jgi:outer membrane protein OmpA-like peptidoglycan-associated protein
MSGSENVLIRSVVTACAVALVALAAPASGADDADREILALSYPEEATVSVKLAGTMRLPGASGEAKVERKKGSTEIEIELDEMKPATLFGGDYATYVLWVVSPEGHVDNTGELILVGNRSKLDVSTPLETFGMLVTAEPHFLVKRPSPLAVLVNSRPTRQHFLATTSRIQYEGSESPYHFLNETLDGLPEAKGEVRPHLPAARSALALAQRARAELYAAVDLERARSALTQAESVAATGAGGDLVMLHAHEAIRAAVKAEEVSLQASRDARLAEEQQEHTERIGDLRRSLETASNEAERARGEAREKALEAAMEADASEAAWREADAAQQRADEAEEERLQALAERAEARGAEARARREQAAARRSMQEALAKVAAVRETARGVIVSIPNVLFEFDRDELRPEGREKLAKIGGILLVSDGVSIAVEGHTDATGSTEYNRNLSDRRAGSVRSYLVAQGLDPGRITARGFGEEQPIAPNASETGRQMNRRVEIVLEEPGDVRAGEAGRPARHAASDR